MSKGFLNLLKLRQDHIVKEWERRLSASLPLLGRDPPNLPEHLVESTFAEFLLLFDIPKTNVNRFFHKPIALNPSDGFPAKLTHSLEIILCGEEVLEDFLVKNINFIQQFSNADQAQLLEETHRTFHSLVELETNAFCSRCFQPFRDVLQHVSNLNQPTEISQEFT